MIKHDPRTLIIRRPDDGSLSTSPQLRRSGLACPVPSGWVGSSSSTNREGRMNSLSGRYVLLTGGSRGIGPVIADALARRGAHLALAARSAAGLRDTCDALRSYGVRTLAVPVDLADATERQRLAERVLNEFDRIDVLVSNAAVENEGAFVQTPWPSVDQTIEVNVAAPIHLTHLLLAHMLRQGHGH